MQKAYDGKPWENYPSDNTPLDEENLNKIHNALVEIDDRVVKFDSTLATKIEISELFTDVVFDEKTGVITFTKKNGSTISLDTKLEKLAVNFAYDPTTERLIITLDDGTEQYVDMSALITQYEFLDSETIGFTVVEGKVKAIVLEGSIKEKHLQPNYLADIKVEVAKAQASEEEATRQKDLSTSEADRAKIEADKAATYSNIVAPDFYVDLETMALYKKGGVGVSFLADENSILYWKIS